MSLPNILPPHFLLQKPFSEHHFYHDGGEYINDDVMCSPYSIFFKSDHEKSCVNFGANRRLSTSYYIGTDWLNEDLAIYVQPKLNQNAGETDYLQMLFSALSHPDIVKYTDDLYEIKWDTKYISINSHQDLLTPLMVVQFLRIVHEIVRKGLKKSYYRVEQNLYSKVKGKILVGQTIKQNLLKNKPLNTYCTFDEFGLNGLENRLLKKALVFVRSYLPKLKIPHSEKYTTEVFNYILPAFDFVSEEVNLNDIKHSKTNAFYKEYEEGIRLAKLILKRFGYNITNTQKDTIQTPPFWIDMSKLFELYVLGMLKDRFGKEVDYHYYKSGNELDYLLNSPMSEEHQEYKMVIDAKYKLYYQYNYDINDIRQISGYARLDSVYKELGKSENEIIDCLIIYPDQKNGHENLNDVELKKSEIGKFNRFYKVAVKLPVMN